MTDMRASYPFCRSGLQEILTTPAGCSTAGFPTPEQCNSESCIYPGQRFCSCSHMAAGVGLPTRCSESLCIISSCQWTCDS
jgi:hypothetical protein